MLWKTRLHGGGPGDGALPVQWFALGPFGAIAFPMCSSPTSHHLSSANPAEETHLWDCLYLLRKRELVEH